MTVVGGVNHAGVSQAIHACSMSPSAHVDTDGSRTPPEGTLDHALVRYVGDEATPFSNLAMSSSNATGIQQGFISFRPGGVADPCFRTPVEQFDALFVGESDPEAAAQRIARRIGVLDAVRVDAARVRSRLGVGDRARLYEGSQRVAELETQTQAQEVGQCGAANLNSPAEDWRTKTNNLLT